MRFSKHFAFSSHSIQFHFFKVDMHVQGLNHTGELYGDTVICFGFKNHPRRQGSECLVVYNSLDVVVSTSAFCPWLHLYSLLSASPQGAVWLLELSAHQTRSQEPKPEPRAVRKMSLFTNSLADDSFCRG